MLHEKGKEPFHGSLNDCLTIMRRKSWKKGIFVLLVSGIFTLFLHQSLLMNVMHLPAKTNQLEGLVRPDVNQIKEKLNPSQKLRPKPTLDVFPGRRVFQADCRKLIEGNREEINRAKEAKSLHKSQRMNNEYFIDLAKNCSYFIKVRHYNVFPVSDEEKTFPIAFSILLYKDVDQAERLLRAIYRPTNVYCFHVDESAEKNIHDGVNQITKCFNNVFVVSKKENVIYGKFSRLQADINCMEDLMKNGIKWKYFINLPSQQFPLKTNEEIVKILKIYNGANDIEGISKQGRMMDHRFKNKTAPPHGAKIIKGSAYGIFSRDMVNFILNDKKAQDILQWSKTINSPDEYYWSILNHNKVLGAPGGYYDDPNKKPWLATYAAWGGRDRCSGKFARGVCVFGVGDLQELVSKKELFANKFYLDYQPLTLDCLEEWLFNKSMSSLPFDTFYYKQLPFIGKT